MLYFVSSWDTASLQYDRCSMRFLRVIDYGLLCKSVLSFFQFLSYLSLRCCQSCRFVSCLDERMFVNLVVAVYPCLL